MCLFKKIATTKAQFLNGFDVFKVVSALSNEPLRSTTRMHLLCTHLHTEQNATDDNFNVRAAKKPNALVVLVNPLHKFTY